MSVIDLGAVKAQQNIDREATACGMADHHSIVVGLAPGNEGMAVQMVLVGTCSKCLSMVRAEWWRKHAETHKEPPTVAEVTQDKLDKMADDMRVPEERKL